MTTPPPRLNRSSRSPGTRAFRPIILLAALAVAIVLSACGGTSDVDTGEAAALRLVAPTEAAELLAGGSDDLVILDVRTQEEFDEGHLDGAMLIDFYGDDFTDALARLDRDRPYVIYCRSGSRSGQTRDIMADLGFSDVADIEGGIVAWQGSGLPIVP